MDVCCLPRLCRAAPAYRVLHFAFRALGHCSARTKLNSGAQHSTNTTACTLSATRRGTVAWELSRTMAHNIIRKTGSDGRFNRGNPEPKLGLVWLRYWTGHVLTSMVRTLDVGGWTSKRCKTVLTQPNIAHTVIAHEFQSRFEPGLFGARAELASR